MTFRIFAVVLFLTSVAQAERITDKSIGSVGTKIEKFLGGKGPALVAFDFDDTLFSTKQTLGSEAWFTWQEKLLQKKGTVEDGLVARDFAHLLDIQQRLLGLVRFHPTETETVPVIQRLQQLGATVIVVSSRGFGDFYSTLREVQSAGLSFGKTRFARELETYKPYEPYRVSRPEPSGFTAGELDALGVQDMRPVVFAEGLYLTDGQHKGAMLRMLLKRTTEKFPKVVFVDNREKHVERVEKAFAKTLAPKALLTVHYNRIDPDAGPGAKVDDWKSVAPLLE